MTRRNRDEGAGASGLSDPERSCLVRYCALLAEGLRERLLVVWMFGSAARGDMWPARAPMHSDIDLLVVTREAIGDAEHEQLVNETYPLYLECGRQLSPHSSANAGWQSPRTSGPARSCGRLSATLSLSGLPQPAPAPPRCGRGPRLRDVAVNGTEN